MEYTIITPVELKHLKQLTILKATDFEPLTCQLVLCDPELGKSVTIAFQGMGEINIMKLSGGSLVGPLKILDMRDRQLEQINYKVMDFEEEHICFFCTAFALIDQQMSISVKDKPEI